MSTICKIDPMVRQRRAYRAALLKMRPRNQKAAIILAELALIHNASRMTGTTKQALFVRGAQQIHSLNQRVNAI